ncbi:unnamed protein product [Closterium sp. NIES-54]
MSTDKLSARAIPFDVTFDESVPFYRLFPYRSAPLPPPPLFLAQGPPPVDPLPPQGPTPSGVSHVDPLSGAVPVEVAIDSSAARGDASGGAASGGAASAGAETARAGSGGAEPGGAEPGGAEPASADPGCAEPAGAEPGVKIIRSRSHNESGGVEPRGTASSGGPAGASPRVSPWSKPLSPQQLREWFAQRIRLRSGGAGAGGSAAGGTGCGGVGATSLGGTGVPASTRGTGGARAAGPGGARTRGIGAARAGGVGGAGAGGVGARGAGAGYPGAGGTGSGGTGAGSAGVGGAGAGDPGTGGAGAVGTGARGAGAGGAGAGCTGDGGVGAVDLEAGGAGAGGGVSGGTGAGGTVQRRPFSVLPPPSSLPPPYSVLRQVLNSFTEQREPESRPALPVRAVRTGRRVPCPCPPPVPGTHVMALRPSFVPLRVPLPPPPESSLPAAPYPESDLARVAIPTVSCLLATVLTDPSFESTATSALVAELVDFAAACCLDYATSLVAESESDCPPSVGGECALGTDVLEDRQEDFECLAAAVPHLVAMLLAPQGDPDAPEIPIPRSYADAITVYGLRQAPREWHDTLRTTLAALGFAPSTADPSLFLRTNTSLPPFYVLVYVDNLVFATADTEALALVKSELQKRHTCIGLGPLALRLLVLLATAHSSVYQSLALSSTSGRVRRAEWPRVLRYLCSTSGMGLVLGGRARVVLTGHADASWVDDLATQRSSQSYTFSLGFGSVSCQSTRSSSVLSSSCEAEIYAWAMAAHELRWLTYLLTDLGEQPRSPPVLYVDNKAMIVLC